MAGIGVPPMYDEFARWYGSVNLGDDQKVPRARWKGITTIVREADRNTIEGLLRLVHQSRQRPAPNVVDKIRQAFKRADAAFEMIGNDHELRVLAASCLAVMMKTDDFIGAVAAVTATTAGFGGVRRPDLPMDLSALGEIAIIRLGDIHCVRPSLEDYMRVPRVDLNLHKAVTEYSAGNIEEAFKIVSAKVRGAVNKLAHTQASAVREIGRFLSIQDEELQMLWWLISHRSTVLDCSFSDVAVHVRPLVIASELAEHTVFLPGPPSVNGLLSRAGLKEEESVRVVNAVSEADFDWLETLVAEVEPSYVSTPLHAAIKRQLETGRGTKWVPGWAASAEVEDDYTMSCLALGNLFYRERLLFLHSK